ncbi:3169_t:CDS:1 [Paraglomus brasilianum]|uniref:3169_t:CDS:1 n=1 Tax=Paraglomus brasilianum TaxID=144538 RepID=A0A9N9FK47_9GLOM|nr:3169_t:CDS:1 [Paraglomus brasilianum]
MKTFIIFALLALYTIAATANSQVALPGGWRIGQANLMDDTLTKRAVGAQITYYEGPDLKNSACYGRNGLRVYNAKPSDFIGAMWMNKFEMCYQCIEIKNGKVKTIVVKIIDKCAGCPKGHKNVDLTKGAFSKLANPIDGRVAIMWRPLPNCPTKGAWPTFEGSKRKIRRSKFE